MDPRNLADRLDERAGLDRLTRPLERAAETALPRGRAKDALHGVWLGHPLHPLLTDLPIGFWTSAWILDLVGGERSAPAAEKLVGLGVVAAAPTAAAGLADWSELNRPERRSGAVHAVANITATVLYAASYVARRRGRRGRGVALGMAGAAAATVGGFLGGHLSYRRAAGVNHITDPASPEDWSVLDGAVSGVDGQLDSAELEGTRLVTVTVDGVPRALADRCSHLGGPLHEGVLEDGCVRCPWHGSSFRVDDGRVDGGPATAPQPAYELRVGGERTEVRRKPLP